MQGFNCRAVGTPLTELGENMLKISRQALARKAMKKGVDLGFAPAFVATMVTYLITANPLGQRNLLGFIGQMLGIIFVSIVYGIAAMIIVAAGVYVIYRLP